MSITQKKTEKRERRRAKIRTKVYGTAEVPRLAIFKSNKFIYGQLINDDTATTIAAASTKDAKGATNLEKAKEAGAAIAKIAVTAGVKKAVFDRGGFIYTGTIEAFATGAREGGLVF